MSWTISLTYKPSFRFSKGGGWSSQEGPGAAEALANNSETPVNCHKGLRVSSSEKGMWPIAQLKCLYTNAHSMGNKQEELAAVAHMENCDLIAITETWWNESHDWGAVIDDCKLFRRDRQGRRGGGLSKSKVQYLGLSILFSRRNCLSANMLWINKKICVYL